jgi:hypothetical protein
LHLTPAEDAWIDAITATAVEVNYLSGVSGNIQTQLSNRYTKAEADAKITALVGSAPATLDTLNELATALGNDANFSTTVTTALGVRSVINPPVAKDGDFKVVGSVVSVYAGGAWRQVFPAVYS